MTTTSAITAPFQLITFTTTDDFTLQPNTKYWLYVTINDGEAIGIRQTQSDDENVESNTDWEIGDSSYRAIDGEAWTEEHGENMQMNISGHPAPAFLVSNLDSPSTLVVFSRGTDIDSAKFAQAFSAANNDTPPSSTSTASQSCLNQTYPPRVTTGGQRHTRHQCIGQRRPAWRPHLYPDLSGRPIRFPWPSGPSHSRHHQEAPCHPVLPTGSSSKSQTLPRFSPLSTISFAFANDNNEVQGPTTENRWSIGDDSLWSPETLSWTD